MNDWIPIEQKKPDDGQEILAVARGYVFCCEVNHNEDHTWLSGVCLGGYEWDFDYDWEDITHWMELPKPPEEVLIK